jgi:AcrR family transcriptional regulator
MSIIKESTDLRSRRTRKWLQKALLELMKEKPFREIQITEIADRADVSRPAFYLHFHSKEELLLSHVDAVFEEFHTELSGEVAKGNIDRRKFSIMLFQYWERYAEILQMVIQADRQSIFLKRVREYVATFMEELTRQQGKERPDPQKQGLVIDFVAGGAYMLLTHWIMNGRPDSAENMGDLLFELTATCELHDAPGSTAV